MAERCRSCGHYDTHDAAGIGVCRAPKCCCDGPVRGEQVTFQYPTDRRRATMGEVKVTGIPAEVKVGAVRYTVLEDAAAIKTWADQHYGKGSNASATAYADHERLLIYLNPAVHSEIKRNSLLHELLHCCLRQSGCWPDAYARTLGHAKGRHGGYDVEELTIAGLTPPLLQVLIDNPELVAFLRLGPNRVMA